MANKRITELQLISDFTDTCNVPLDDTIQSYRVTGLKIWDYIRGKSNNNLFSAKSADYTILDTDNIRTVAVTTAGTDRTMTLPSASNNTNRIITIKKVDSGTGRVIISGTIDGVSGFKLYLQYDAVTVQSNGTNWNFLDKTLVLGTDYVGLGGNGYGSTDTSVRRFSSNTDGNCGVTTSGAGVGQYWTCSVPGKYYVTYRDFRSSNIAWLVITKNSTKLTSGSVPLATDSFVEFHTYGANNVASEGGCVIECTEGDIIRFQSVSATTTGNDCRGIIRMIARI